MNCDEAGPRLFDLTDGSAGREARAELEQHVSGCAQCSAALAALREWRERADAWQDAPVPRWRRPAVERPAFWRDWRQWFPLAVSAAALVVAGAVLLRAPAAQQLPLQGSETASSPPNAVAAQWRRELEAGSQTDRALLVQAVLEASRSQREQELAALAAVLKGEMDRRALETERSLRYIVTHQVQDERRLNDLVHFVGGLDHAQEEQP